MRLSCLCTVSAMIMSLSTSLLSTLTYSAGRSSPVASSSCIRASALCQHRYRCSSRHFSKAVEGDERPLAGVKVLDLTRVLAGPLGTMMLVGIYID